MFRRTMVGMAVFLMCSVVARGIAAETISVEGAPADSGFNVGSVATVRATVRGLSGDVTRYAVFAEFQYVGTHAVASVQMDREGEGSPGEAHYEVGWPIPADAPTGLYSVVVKVEDRNRREEVASQKLRSFAAYKKLLEIAGLRIDKTFYSVGDTIQCELALENLTDHELNDLRVEFSNSNYPWISLFAPGSSEENIQLGLNVLRDHLNVPAHGRVAIPMMPAGKAAFLQGMQRAVMGTGGPERHEKVPPPEVDQYTVAVWNGDRTVLYDMQFTRQAIVRPPDRDRPKPYGQSFTHPYNADIDFTQYRQFYPPGVISPAIQVDRLRTLYRPGDSVSIAATLKNPGSEAWSALHLQATVLDSDGRPIQSAVLASEVNLHPGQSQAVSADAWKIPASIAPGTYRLQLALIGVAGVRFAETTSEVAVNTLPGSILVFCPHEDDELSYAGLVRAAVEAGIPVRVVILTGGDVGACERYYAKPCGPNEAREFGGVRMEESAEALEHMGLSREKLTILGLPDGGSGEIWFHHRKVSDPFLSIYLACDHAPYENVWKPNLPYARDAVIDSICRP